MIATGATPKVHVTKKEGFNPEILRDVYAIRDQEGDVQVLVANDQGKLGWVQYADYQVARH